MTNCLAALQKTLLCRDLREVFVQRHSLVHHRSDLQQIERRTLVRLQIAGKLYLHGSPHLILTVLENHLQDLGQWNYVVLQYAAETHQLSVLALIETIVDALVEGVEGGAYPLQFAVLFRLAHGMVAQVEAVVGLEREIDMVEVECQKARLRVLQRNVCLAHLQYLVGMIGRETQTDASVHDVFSKSQCQTDGSLLGLLVVQRIVVQAACHATHCWIEAALMLVSHHFLQDDRHLLLVDDVGCCGHIVLGGAIENAGIHRLDGIGKHFQTLVVVAYVGNHVGTVDACKRLIMTVLEQRAGADGNGCLHHVEKSHQVAEQTLRQSSVEEVMQNVLVGNVGQGYLVKLVRIHELIKHVGAENHGLGNADVYVVELVGFGMMLDDVVQESQSASLAAQRSVADAGEIAVLVEALALEHRHNALVAHAPVCHDGVEDDFAVRVDVLQAVPGDAFQKLADGEKGAGAEPSADVVVGDMVEQRFGRHAEDVLLQVFKIMATAHLVVRRRVAEDEVAEAKAGAKNLAQVVVQFLAAFVDETCAALLGELAARALACLQNQRKEGVSPSDVGQQLEACQLVDDAVLHETAIGNDAQRVVVKMLVQLPSLLVVPGEHNLGTATHAQCLQVRVQRLAGKGETLLKYIFI